MSWKKALLPPCITRGGNFILQFALYLSCAIDLIQLFFGFSFLFFHWSSSLIAGISCKYGDWTLARRRRKDNFFKTMIRSPNLGCSPSSAISHKPTPKRSGWCFFFFKKKNKDQGCINFSSSNLIVHGTMATPLRIGEKRNMCMDIITWSAKWKPWWRMPMQRQ